MKRSRAHALVRLGLRLIGPVLLVVILLRLDDPMRLVHLVRGANPWLLALSIALNVPAIVLKVLRWRVFMRARGFDYATYPASLAFGASLYAGLLTPGRVGDVLRIQYARHEAKMPYAEGLASVVVDRLCDLYVLAGFVALAVVHFSKVLGTELRTLSYVVLAGTLLGPLLLLVPGLAERVLSRAYARFAGKGDPRGLTLFLEASRDLMKRTFLPTVPVTVLSFLLGFSQSWLIARALALPIGFFDIMCLTAVASLLGLIPISVSGLGVREAFFVAVAPSLGLEADAAMGLSLMVFLVIYLALAAIGFVCWQIKPPPTGAAAGASPPPDR